MWSPKLRTQLSSAWIPDPGKWWDNKCVLFQAVKYVICYMAIEECRLLQENLRACDTELLGPEAQGFLGWLLLFPSRSEVLLGWAPGSGDEESWAFSLSRWRALWVSRVPVSLPTGSGASLCLPPTQAVLFPQSAHLPISLSVSYLSGYGPATVGWYRRQADTEQGSAASAAWTAGLGPSADSSGAAVWVDGAQGLASPGDPSIHPLPGKHQMTWGLGWGGRCRRSPGGVSQRVLGGGVSPPHSAWRPLFASYWSGPLSAGPSGWGPGDVQVPQGGVPEGRLYEEPVGGVWGWHEFSLSWQSCGFLRKAQTGVGRQLGGVKRILGWG